MNYYRAILGGIVVWLLWPEDYDYYDRCYPDGEL